MIFQPHDEVSSGYTNTFLYCKPSQALHAPGPSMSQEVDAVKPVPKLIYHRTKHLFFRVSLGTRVPQKSFISAPFINNYKWIREIGKLMPGLHELLYTEENY